MLALNLLDVLSHASSLGAVASRERIVLRPIRADDFEGELEGIAADLREALPNVRVEIWDPLRSPPGSLPAFSEVLSVILPMAGGYAFTKTVDLILKGLPRPRRTDDQKPPARFVEFYGPSGEVLKRVQISDDDGVVDLDD